LARTAQGFGRTLRRCARNQVDGRVQIDPPAWVHHQGADPWLRPHPASDHLVADSKRTRGAATITRPFAFRKQWPVCYAYRRNAELGAKVQRQPSPTGVITASGVEQQHVRPRRQTPDRLFHQPTDPEG
jgi:hypothetical protein